VDIDLITAAQQLWTQRRQGTLTPDQHEVALFALERSYGLDVAPCAACGIRHAQRWDWASGTTLCFRCREIADAIDRGWDDYKEATDV
jgi:hypothetical protein